MSTLLLTSPADRHSRAFGDRTKARPRQIHLLVDTPLGKPDRPAATSNKKILSKMLAICSLSRPYQQKDHQATGIKK